MIFNSYYSFIKQPSNDTRKLPSFPVFYIYIYIYFFVVVVVVFPFQSLEFSHLFPDFSTSVQYLAPQIFILLHCISCYLKCCKYSGKSGRLWSLPPWSLCSIRGSTLLTNVAKTDVYFELDEVLTK